MTEPTEAGQPTDANVRPHRRFDATYKTLTKKQRKKENELIALLVRLVFGKGRKTKRSRLPRRSNRRPTGSSLTPTTVSSTGENT